MGEIYANNCTGKDERPTCCYSQHKSWSLESEVPDDVRKSMNRNGQREDTASQIASADEPTLSPAHWCADSNSINAEPVCVDHERGCLLDVCYDEIEDQDQNLVDTDVAISPPPDEEPG